MKRKAGRLYVDGNWIEGSEVVEIRSPFDQSVVGRHHRAGLKQVDLAIAAAERAFREHRTDPASSRSARLAACARIVERRKEKFAQSISAEAGKPITYARGEVERALHTIRCSAEEAVRIGGELLPLDAVPFGDHHLGITRRFPVGVILAITPFNFPLNLVCHKVGPALAAGCSLVLRPASQTPLTALLLAEAAEEAGLPAGLLNVVPSPVQLAESMIQDPRVRMVTFTGSPLVGWPLKQQAANRKVTLELGGNAAVVFDHDFDPGPVIPKIAASAYGYAGQSCISVQRVFVPSGIEKAFVEAFVAHVREKVPYGDPRLDETVSGPLIRSEETDRVMGWCGDARDSRAAVRGAFRGLEEPSSALLCRSEKTDGVMAWIADARESGAEVLVGGHRLHNVIEPTLLRKVDPKCKVSCREVFGPVAVLDTFDRFDEAIEKVNASDFGLQAGLFTHHIGHAFRAFRDIEVGAVTINETPTYRVDHMPYGGVKESGFGREGIRYAIEEMTEPRPLVLHLDR